MYGSPPAERKYTGTREPDSSCRAPSNAATAPSHAPTNGPAQWRNHTSWAWKGESPSRPPSARPAQKSARPTGATATQVRSRARRGEVSHHSSASGTTSTTPALRVAAASAPRIPAHAQRPVRAARTVPTDSARKRLSEYTAERKNAIGKHATRMTVARAGPSPSSIAVSRCSAARPATAHTSDTAMPPSREEATTAPAARDRNGYSGKNAARTASL